MSALDELKAHLPDELVVVDVGCRWGFAPHWEELAPHLVLIGFDADEAEVVRLREEFANRPHMHFVARALGSQSGQTTLIRTHEAGGTSVLGTDWSRLTHLPDYEGARIVDKREVDLSTLDHWMDEEGPTRIDALKLDTQGSELDILRGAVNSLERTRHVEVEVAFNELFEGGPLFGEVDAFLRAQGFALWRFRDLVHHALRDAPDPPRVTEHIWYEGIADPLSARGGQLIWCNAHFVRRDMYVPTSRLGWQTRLRDVCLMHALAFHDLAILSIKRLLAEPDCPDAVSRSAERMLAEALAAPELDRPAPTVSPLAKLVRRVRAAGDGLFRSSDQQTH
jgi:FkbM family methyltransferase